MDDESRLWALSRAADPAALEVLLRVLRRKPLALEALEDLAKLPAHEGVWEAITEVLDAHAAALGAHEALLRRVDESLSRSWPTTARKTPDKWIKGFVQGQYHLGWSLCRVLDLSSYPVSVTAAQRLIDARPSPFEAIAHLDLSNKRWFADTWRRLFAHPALGRLQTLRLHEVHFSAQLLAQVGASPHLDGLRVFSLMNSPLQVPGEGLSLGDWRWPGLRHLSLVGLGLGGLVGLGDWEAGGALESLNLSDNRLDDVAVYRLATGRWKARLQRLDLSGNPLGADIGIHLCEWEALQALTALRLSDTGLSVDALTDLLLSPAMGSLQYLDVSSNPGLHQGGLEALGGCAMGCLAGLVLARVRLDPKGLEAVLGAGWVKQLKVLDLSGNALGDEGVARLARCEALGGVETLVLSDCDVGPKGVEALVESNCFSNLRHLDVSRNRLGNRGAVLFAKEGGFLRLQTLDVSQNRVWRDGAEVLGRWAQAAGVAVTLDLPNP